MIPLTFVHAADLHLDSPFRTLEVHNKAIADVFREATFAAFRNLITLCKQQHADFLLIAGDVYDDANRSMHTQVRFRKGLQELADAGIRTYVVHGNHDPLDGRCSQLRYPDTVHVFGDDVEVVHFAKQGRVAASIYGVSYPTRNVSANLARRYRRQATPQGDVSPHGAASDVFHIGLLHCNLDGNPDHGAYAPCTSADLLEAGMDYWALGHVHHRWVRSEQPRIVYPGNLQGRSVRETGAKGCVVVQVDAAGQAHVSFHPTDVVRWDVLRIPIGGGAAADRVAPATQAVATDAVATEAVIEAEITSEQALLDRVHNRLAEARAAAEGRHVAVRIVLEGRGELYSTVRAPGYAEDLRQSLREEWSACDPFVWIDDVRVDVQPVVDLAQLQAAAPFVAELLSAFAQTRSGADAWDTIRNVLQQELYAKRDAAGIINPLTETALQELLDEAQRLCLDHLLLDGEAR